MLALPLELWLYCGSFLPLPCLITLCGTCRSIRHALLSSTKLWQTLCFWLPPPSDARITPRCRSRHYNIDDSTIQLFLTFWERNYPQILQNIRHVFLDGTLITSTTVINVFTHCPNVQVFTAQFAHVHAESLSRKFQDSPVPLTELREFAITYVGDFVQNFPSVQLRSKSSWDIASLNQQLIKHTSRLNSITPRICNGCPRFTSLAPLDCCQCGKQEVLCISCRRSVICLRCRTFYLCVQCRGITQQVPHIPTHRCLGCGWSYTVCLPCRKKAGWGCHACMNACCDMCWEGAMSCCRGCGRAWCWRCANHLDWINCCVSRCPECRFQDATELRCGRCLAPSDRECRTCGLRLCERCQMGFL